MCCLYLSDKLLGPLYRWKQYTPLKPLCLHTSKKCKVPEDGTFIRPTAVTSNLACLFHAYLYWLNLIVLHFSGLENYQSVDLLQDLIKSLYCCSEMKKLQRKPHFKYLQLFCKNFYSSTLNCQKKIFIMLYAF